MDHASIVQLVASVPRRAASDTGPDAGGGSAGGATGEAWSKPYRQLLADHDQALSVVAELDPSAVELRLEHEFHDVGRAGGVVNAASDG
jgi:hypothetical protein